MKPNDLRRLSLMSRLILIVLQKLVHSLDFIFETLPFVRPRANADVTLDAHDAVGVQHAVCLTDDVHYLVP
jgi:hypothetical protein